MMHATSNANYHHQVTNATGVLNHSQNVKSKRLEAWPKTNVKKTALVSNIRNATSRLTNVMTAQYTKIRAANSPKLTAMPFKKLEDARPHNLMDSTERLRLTKKYIKGEYDLLFKDSKMYMQYFDTKVETKELGEFKQTGVTDEGLVTFEVMNFKKDDKIWPFDTLHGVYKEAFGQDNIFKFLEIAFSKDEIKDLDQGLDGVNGRYWVGVKCISA